MGTEEPEARRYMAGRVKDCVDKWGDFPMRAATFLSNHDQDRVARKLFTQERQALAARVLLTLPGVPFLYYGEEIGLSSAHHDDGKARRPMPWTNTTPGYGFTSGNPWQPPYIPDGGSMPTVEQSTLLPIYRAAIAVRKRFAELFSCKPIWLDAGHAAILSYHLASRSGHAFIVHNTDAGVLTAHIHYHGGGGLQPQTYNLADAFQMQQIINVQVEEGGQYTTEIVLQPFSSALFVFPRVPGRMESIIDYPVFGLVILCFVCCFCVADWGPGFKVAPDLTDKEL